jgi:hypothetical protein
MTRNEIKEKNQLKKITNNNQKNENQIEKKMIPLYFDKE